MSNPTASLFLDTRRALKDGSFPIKLTIYYLGKKRQFATPFRLTEEAYKKVQASNLKDQELKSVRNRIYKWLGEQQAILRGMEKFDFDAFESEFSKGERETKNHFALEQVRPFFEDYINKLRLQERIKTAESYQSANNSLFQFRRYLKFSDIDRKSTRLNSSHSSVSRMPSSA